MLPKVLAWSSLVTALLFAILMMTAIFAYDSLGEDSARLVVSWGAIPLLAIAILLALTLLIVSAFATDS